MITDSYFYETMIRFEMAKNHPELLAKLEKQIEKEQQEHVKTVAKEFGLKVKFAQG
jgi:hypothetical protein